MNTSPLGDWTFIQSGKQSIQYEKFLDTMVSKSIEVRQRMAELALDNVLAYEQSDRNYIRIAHATKITGSNIPTTPCKYGECLADGIH